MEIVGRLTAQATVKTTNGGREFVTFTVVENNDYKDKSGQWVKNPTFYQCAFWRSTAVARILTKAAMVQVSGKIGLNVWNNSEGEAQGRLTMNVQEIKPLLSAKKAGNEHTAPAAPVAATTESADDLPF